MCLCFARAVRPSCRGCVVGCGCGHWGEVEKVAVQQALASHTHRVCFTIGRHVELLLQSHGESFWEWGMDVSMWVSKVAVTLYGVDTGKGL